MTFVIHISRPDLTVHETQHSKQNCGLYVDDKRELNDDTRYKIETDFVAVQSTAKLLVVNLHLMKNCPRIDDR